jgi:hypothetical protein
LISHTLLDAGAAWGRYHKTGDVAGAGEDPTPLFWMPFSP